MLLWVEAVTAPVVAAVRVAASYRGKGSSSGGGNFQPAGKGSNSGGGNFQPAEKGSSSGGGGFVPIALILHAARNGAGERQPCKGMLVLVGSEEQFNKFGFTVNLEELEMSPDNLTNFCQ